MYRDDSSHSRCSKWGRDFLCSSALLKAVRTTVMALFHSWAVVYYGVLAISTYCHYILNTVLQPWRFDPLLSTPSKYRYLLTLQPCYSSFLLYEALLFPYFQFPLNFLVSGFISSSEHLFCAGMYC